MLPFQPFDSKLHPNLTVGIDKTFVCFSHIISQGQTMNAAALVSKVATALRGIYVKNPIWSERLRNSLAPLARVAR